MPSPVLWGDETTVHERLGEGLAELELVRRDYTFSYPFPPSEVVEFFRLNYGPINQAFAALDVDGCARLRQEIEALWSAHNRAGMAVPRSSLNIWKWLAFEPELSKGRIASTSHSVTKEVVMYDLKNLSKMKNLQTYAPEAMKAFVAFDKAAVADGAIPAKYKELMALAVRSPRSAPIASRSTRTTREG